jgi:hypothetical protein
MKKINDIFKPSKITISGKVKIVDTDSGKYVIKPKNKNINDLYSYLKMRSFDNYPALVDEYDNNYVYEYVKDNKVPLNQKAADMANLLASLHNKTAYYKPIVIDNIKEIYENLDANISYFNKYYEDLFTRWEVIEVMPPSAYLLLRNRTKIISLGKFIKSELDAWYKLMSDKTKERVVYNHNNLSINHYIENEKDYFISWDNYIIDTPVLDLINLYHNDYNKYDFSNFLNVYQSHFSLLEEEKKLFFITISLPTIKFFSDDEMQNTVIAGSLLDYITTTEKLIRPYYTVEDVKK